MSSDGAGKAQRTLELAGDPMLRERRFVEGLRTCRLAIEYLLSISKNSTNIERLQQVKSGLLKMGLEADGAVHDLKRLIGELGSEVAITVTGAEVSGAAAKAATGVQDGPTVATAELTAPAGRERPAREMQPGRDLFDDMELGPVTATPPTRAPVKMKYTPEQDAIIECDAKNMVVNAFAGSGKTSTLIGYTRHRPQRRVLYLAFNHAIAKEAERKFPKNVTAKTSHAVAMAACGRKYSKKLGNPRARDVMEFLESKMRIPVESPGDRYLFCQAALDRVKDFFGEGGHEPTIPDRGKESWTMPSGVKIDGREVVAAARLVWASMCEVDKGLSMPHDGYLKLFQLTSPNLSDYDCIVVDEAQDTNPCLFDIVRQQSTGKVLVGDRHQGIYSFRGSMNAMAKLAHAKSFPLTNSFRFGKSVEKVANAILAVYCGETLRLKGVGAEEMPEKPTRAELFRTNAGLFSGAVEWLEMTGGAGGLHLVGGVEGYNLDVITDTSYLMDGNNGLIQDPFVRKFRDYSQLKNYAESVNDKEVIARLKIVERYASGIPELVDRVKKAQVPASRALMQMTTAHKSKGLEFDEVTLAGDFPELLSDTGLPRTKAYLGEKADSDQLLSVEEANLYYVASTRAKAKLNMNEQLMDYMFWAAANVELEDPVERALQVR